LNCGRFLRAFVRFVGTGLIAIADTNVKQQEGWCKQVPLKPLGAAIHNS